MKGLFERVKKAFGYDTPKADNLEIKINNLPPQTATSASSKQQSNSERDVASVLETVGDGEKKAPKERPPEPIYHRMPGDNTLKRWEEESKAAPQKPTPKEIQEKAEASGYASTSKLSKAMHEGGVRAAIAQGTKDYYEEKPPAVKKGEVKIDYDALSKKALDRVEKVASHMNIHVKVEGEAKFKPTFEVIGKQLLENPEKAKKFSQEVMSAMSKSGKEGDEKIRHAIYKVVKSHKVELEIEKTVKALKDAGFKEDKGVQISTPEKTPAGPQQDKKPSIKK